MFPPGLEPGTFRVLGERDNHYTTETCEIQNGNPRKLCYQKHAYEHIVLLNNTTSLFNWRSATENYAESSGPGSDRGSQSTARELTMNVV